ncbi:hypothetical protein [Nostoc sp. NZL]|uniref:hypothetical protein n=1 Tax=Nostoc sp. NZL TaxID=2650612 RepID=UPI0018C5F36D|nr:hypothetical protein [Nostoc sp. NZL]MBG1241574.1 hypothetical protein [Nostoc sp. NZL]
MQVNVSKVQVDVSKLQTDATKVQVDTSKVQVNASKLQVDATRLQLGREEKNSKFYQFTAFANPKTVGAKSCSASDR